MRLKQFPINVSQSPMTIHMIIEKLRQDKKIHFVTSEQCSRMGDIDEQRDKMTKGNHIDIPSLHGAILFPILLLYS